jgi:hypothetical protein
MLLQYTTFLQAAESVAALKTPEAVFPAVSLFFGARVRNSCSVCY